MLNTDDNIVWTELTCMKLKLYLQFTAMLLLTGGLMLDSLDANSGKEHVAFDTPSYMLTGIPNFLILLCLHCTPRCDLLRKLLGIMKSDKYARASLTKNDLTLGCCHHCGSVKPPLPRSWESFADVTSCICTTNLFIGGYHHPNYALGS